MSPQEQYNKILDPTLVVIFKWEEIVKLGLTFAEVLGAWDRGVLLDQNIYILKKKVTVMTELTDQSE
jgi:hypothetical protein